MNNKANAYITVGLLIAYFAPKGRPTIPTIPPFKELGSGNEHENPFQQVHRRIKQKKASMPPPLELGDLQPGIIGAYRQKISQMSGFGKAQDRQNFATSSRKPDLQALDRGVHMKKGLPRTPRKIYRPG
jgi:hypothetical protein